MQEYNSSCLVQVTGDAWLSSDRTVKRLVKSSNDRNFHTYLSYDISKLPAF